MQKSFKKIIGSKSIQIGLVILIGFGLLLSFFFYTKNHIEIDKLTQLTDNSNNIVNELDNFLQIEQIYMGNFTQNGLLQLTKADQYSSLKEDLSIFPFFFPINIV